MHALKLYFTALFVLFAAWTASAQTTVWDAALDRYENICSQCIDLRLRSLAGEQVSATSITDLLGQLASLRNSLQKAAGQMTPAQRVRFERIRVRYSMVFSLSSSTKRTSILPLLEPVAGLPSLRPERPAALLSQGSLSGRSARPGSPGSLPLQGSVGGKASRTGISGRTQPEDRFRYGLIAYASIAPARPGLMARIDMGRYGIFLKGTFRPSHKADYTCFSDGTKPGGFIWTSGKEASSAASITAGATWAPVPTLRIYTGAGYGMKKFFWEDASGPGVRPEHIRRMRRCRSPFRPRTPHPHGRRLHHFLQGRQFRGRHRVRILTHAFCGQDGISWPGPYPRITLSDTLPYKVPPLFFHLAHLRPMFD